MNPETKMAWHPLKREFEHLNWDNLRIDALGIPDVNVHVPKVGDVWIELKYVSSPPRYPATGTIEIGLRREQFIWMRDARRAGRKVLLLARIGAVWYSWEDVESWELAKHSNPWKALLRKATVYMSPAAFAESLREIQP